MTAAEYGSLPFQEQIQFFRGKRPVPTRRWNDLWRDQHDSGFMIAGAIKDDLLADFHQAVGRFIEEGRTLQDFRTDFDKIVAAHGWSYKGGRNWRTRVIYDTNLRQSYNAGRYRQMKQVAHRRPYWRYRHSDASANPRKLHLSWDGLVLRHDHPWWHTHTPMNGWGCKCRIETLSDRDLERLGIKPGIAPDDGDRPWTDPATGQTHRVPNGIDPGFDYPPGRSARDANTPQEARPGLFQPFPDQPRATDPLPPPRPADPALLMPTGRAATDYIDAFLRAFGAARGKPLLFTDSASGKIEISDALFRKANGRYKVRKEGRERYVRLLARAIQDPDEIWLLWGRIGTKGKVRLRRRYIARFAIDGEDTPAFVAFERDTRTWNGTTAFPARDDNYLQAQRMGKRVYRRSGEEGK